MQKVLVVEDSKTWSSIISRGLEGKVEVIQAFTIPEARDAFQQHPDLAVIVVDACVPGDVPTTIPLVRKMRETFKGPMVAISSASDYRKELLEAGCDHESGKAEVAGMVLGLLVGAS